MSKERLNYKECRENVFKLIEKSSILSREEIVKALGISFKDLVYTNPYYKFSNFLKYARRYAHQEYCKTKNKKIIVSRIIFLRDILNKNKGSIKEFIQFCEIRRIPLLYYVPKIRKYIFPNDQLLNPIYNRLYIISIKGFITSLKSCEIFGMYRNIEEIILVFLTHDKQGYNLEENEVSKYISSFLRKNYIFGEEKEQMFERLEYTKKLKGLNDKIEKNLYSIANLELLKD